ncbi:MAG: RNA 3'-terminal phosphate cyclase [Syntrophorhabdaceae bacterium]
MNDRDMIFVDGSVGEGGGQILRTSLTLSMITGKPVHIANIRPRRSRPAIQRQHLAAIKAAQEICSARVQGAQVNSREVRFTPGEVMGGTYEFSIGSAGSATLVLQTVLLPLVFARAPSEVSITGGTHNIWAPPLDFFDSVYLPLVRRMGPSIALKLLKYGFHSAGGGLVHASVHPAALSKKLDMNERGMVKRVKATAVVTHLPESIGHREIAILRTGLGDNIEATVKTVDSPGPGNVLLVEIISEHITEIVTSFGRRGLPAETVARNAVSEVRDYIASGVPIGMHLADQLVMPLSLAGTGSFTTMAPTGHLRTNIEVIKKFLPVDIRIDRMSEIAWRVSVSSM